MAGLGTYIYGPHEKCGQSSVREAMSMTCSTDFKDLEQVLPSICIQIACWNDRVLSIVGYMNYITKVNFFCFNLRILKWVPEKWEVTRYEGNLRSGGRRTTKGEGDDRGWDGWRASPTRWTWVWASSGRWWRTGKPYWLCQRLWLCRSQQTVANSSGDRNTRPPGLHPEKSVCGSRSNS